MVRSTVELFNRLVMILLSIIMVIAVFSFIDPPYSLYWFYAQQIGRGFMVYNLSIFVYVIYGLRWSVR